MYVLGEPDCACLYCGGEIVPGDEIYDTDEGFVHDECFFEYLRHYAKEAGWKQYAYTGDKK